MKNVTSNTFNSESLGDLGTTATPLGVDEVGYMIQMSHLAQADVEYPCIFCGKEGTHKIMRKKLGAFTGEKGYVCANCLQQGKLDGKLYGIRERGGRHVK